MKISVIIPVYNVEKYLRDCLDSVINQTLKEIEIICINDGSTDDSGKIIDEYAKKDERIKVIHKKNEGVSIARNLGIKIATGKFVCFIDPDDIYPTNDILNILYDKTIENQVLICGGEFSMFFNQSKQLYQNFQSSMDGYLFQKNEIIAYKNYQFDYGYHRFLYNRKFLIENNIFFPLYKRFADPPFMVKAMILSKKFYAMHKITYAYRQAHKIGKIDEKYVNGILNGLIDNFKFSQFYALEKLKKYSIARFHEHRYIIMKYFFDKGCHRLMSEISKLSGIDLKKEYCKLLVQKFTQKIFSIKKSNNHRHKTINLLGIKLKIKRRRLVS